MGVMEAATIGLIMGGGVLQQRGMIEEQKQQADFVQAKSDELGRLTGIAKRNARQKASDRVLQANKQWSNMVAALADQGAGSTMLDLTNELNYLTGTDLDRIDQERNDTILGYKAEGENLKSNYKSYIKQHRLQRLGALLNTAGSALGVAQTSMQNSAMLDAARGVSPGVGTASASAGGSYNPAAGPT